MSGGYVHDPAQFLADCAAYWVEHDALPTQAERTELHKQFLLAHGATMLPVWHPRNKSPWPELFGGLEPVRVD